MGYVRGPSRSGLPRRGGRLYMVLRRQEEKTGSGYALGRKGELRTLASDEGAKQKEMKPYAENAGREKKGRSSRRKFEGKGRKVLKKETVSDDPRRTKGTAGSDGIYYFV